MARITWRFGLSAAAFSGFAVLGVLPAGAQHYYPAPRVYAPAPPPPPAYPALAPHQADAVVRSLGLTPVSRALPRGPVYVVHAVGREGSEVRVTVDRYSGRVMQIVRLGRSAPRIAALPPGYEPPLDPDDDRPAIADDDFPPAPGDDDYEEQSSAPAPSAGPSVITRRGIQADELPPPGQQRYGAPRDADVTGSVPRRASSASVDPLLGVPKEFRGQPQRTARAPDPAPRATPMPRPRPADAPQVAQVESAQPPAAKPELKKEEAPAAKADPIKVPDVQGFE